MGWEARSGQNYRQTGEKMEGRDIQSPKTSLTAGTLFASAFNSYSSSANRAVAGFSPRPTPVAVVIRGGSPVQLASPVNRYSILRNRDSSSSMVSAAVSVDAGMDVDVDTGFAMDPDVDAYCAKDREG